MPMHVHHVLQWPTLRALLYGSPCMVPGPVHGHICYLLRIQVRMCAKFIHTQCIAFDTRDFSNVAHGKHAYALAGPLSHSTVPLS